MKTILLARVSSKEQEEGQSIPAQVRRLREYAEKNALAVIHEFQLIESSTKETRKEFNKIVGIIEKSKDCIALVVDIVDRLQRSFNESVVLLDLLKKGKLTLHFLREGLVLHQNSNSSDLIRWDINVFASRAFVLQLADNVKRSLDEARKNGIRSGLAPLGYLNVKDNQNKKDVVPDPNQSHLIVKMFEMYSTGNYSIRQIADEMEKLGLKSKRGKSVVLSKIDDALKDPFYYGIMKTKYGQYPHRHEPLISYDLFEKAQQVRLSRKQKPFQPVAKPFIFRGLITCSNCQCLISPEIKREQYVYYSCTNAKKICERVYVREELFLEKVGSSFEDLQLSQEIVDAITSHIRESYDSEHRFSQAQRDRLKKEQFQIQQRISKLYDDHYDGNISADFFNKKLKEYKDKEQEITREMERYVVKDTNAHITANTVLSLASRARDIFESSEVDEKRQLLNFVFQNLELKEKKLSVTLREPFKMIKDASLSGKRPRICR